MQWGNKKGNFWQSQEQDCAVLQQCLRPMLSRGRDAAARAREILARKPIAQLSQLTPAEWRALLPLSPTEAKRLWAAFALGRQVEICALPHRPMLRRAKDVYAFVAPRLRGLQQEVFLALHLNVQNRLQAVSEVSAGTLTSSLVHPREVFGPALADRAASLLVVHNHPSGDPEPSQADREVTRRLIRAGRLLGIPLVDHVICGHQSWRSMRECMNFEEGDVRVAESGGGDLG